MDFYGTHKDLGPPAEPLDCFRLPGYNQFPLRAPVLFSEVLPLRKTCDSSQHEAWRVMVTTSN